MKYVILGAGPAGVVAAETLAKEDPGSSITLIGAEPHPPYSRMAIPYVLTGKIQPEGAFLRKTEGHYSANGIAYIQGKVVKVDADTLTFADGQSVDFDKLLIATGSSPVAPPLPGMGDEGVHHCWTLEDVEAIAHRAQKGADVVLMGAGFIGCIILESLVERGVNLTVIEAEDRMISKMMNATGGKMLADWVASKGVTLMTSTKVNAIAHAGSRLSVSTDKGDDISADLVVVATGVKSNTGFLDGSGVEVDQGVVVDAHLQSSVANIYAAGDVAQGPDFGGGMTVHAVQPTAVEHGRIAALNMAGKDVPYNGSLIMNVLDTMGLISASFGRWDGGDDSAEKVDAENFRYTKLAFDGDVLVGALSLGRTDHIGVMRGLIQGRVNLGAWKSKLKADPNLIAEAYVACTRT